MMRRLQLKQPKGFYSIAFGEMAERFSYYGAQSLLVLCLTQFFLLDDHQSYSVFGAYTTFSFALPVLGGFLADRFLGLRQSIFMGGLLLIVGNLLMAIQKLPLFYLGLALTACGTGFYKPNSTRWVGQLYGSTDRKLHSGFTLFYMGMNLGATASPFIYGLSKIGGFQYGYLISAILMLVNWVVFWMLYARGSFPSETLKFKWAFSKWCFIYFVVFLGIALVSLLFFYSAWLNHFLSLFGAVVLFFLISTTFKQKKEARNRLLGLFTLSFFGMCFFGASLQTGSSINLFIERDVYRTLGGWEIPTVMFSSLYPLAVIVATPFVNWGWSFLARRHKEPSASVKLGLSLIGASLAFVCFAFAAYTNHSDRSHLPLVWIVLGNLCLGMGELCLMPTMFSAITLLAPENLRSTLVGVWFLFVAFGGYLSSIVAQVNTRSDLKEADGSTFYTHAFVEVAVVSFFMGCILFMITPWVKSLIHTE